MTVLAQDAAQSNKRNTNSDPDRIIISEWRLNGRETARVTIEKYNGVWLINVRKWFEGEDGGLRPGKHGIAFAVKHLPRLAEAMLDARDTAIERALVGGEGGHEHSR
jgi:Transcriptional Coactivator p15 (PC4)